MGCVARPPPWRTTFVVVLFGLLFAGIGLRAFFVQIVGSDFYFQQGELRYARKMEMPATRGRILDRNGHTLAASVPATSIWALPTQVDASPAQRAKLARLLGLSLRELTDRLNEDSNFVWLRRRLDRDVADAVLELGLRGVHQMSEYKRVYPDGEMTAHVVGSLNAEQKGREGIELAFEQELAGSDGQRRVIKDRYGRVVEELDVSKALSNGRDVTLSIDVKVQYISHRRLSDLVGSTRAAAGALVSVDTRTGEVLAMNSLPAFSPSDRSALTGSALRNRAVTDTFEPGSTAIPFIAARAIESGRMTPSTIVQAQGVVAVGGTTIRDLGGNGPFTLSDIVRRSSQAGAAKIAMQMQPREIWELYAQLGFGEQPRLELPGALAGRLGAYRTWRPSEQAAMGYGYGLSGSLLQLARAYTTFAREGEVIPVTMLRNVDTVTGLPVISPATARSIRTMLAAAHADRSGDPATTLRSGFGSMGAALPKIESAGYSTTRHRHVAVCMAPIHHPHVVSAVLLDEPVAALVKPGSVRAACEQVASDALQALGVPVVRAPALVPPSDLLPAERDRF